MDKFILLVLTNRSEPFAVANGLTSTAQTVGLNHHLGAGGSDLLFHLENNFVQLLNAVDFF